MENKLEMQHVKGFSNGKRIPEYSAWKSMRDRCLNIKHKFYHHYGGRGITVCDRWLGENGFQRFIKDMGFKPSEKHSLDRIDNNGGYNPTNCRWATWIEQKNNRRVNVFIEHNGMRLTKAQWARLFNKDDSNVFANKKKTFEQIYNHYINGGGYPSIKVELDGETLTITELQKKLTIGDRYLRQLLKRNHLSVKEIHEKYKK